MPQSTSYRRDIVARRLAIAIRSRLTKLFASLRPFGVGLFCFGSVFSGVASNALADPNVGSEDYVFAGRIDGASADKAMAELKAGSYRRFVVTSPGGDEASALRIAREIEHLNLQVVARRYCLSSCALYLLPASRGQAVVEAETLVAFHLNTPGLLPLLPRPVVGSSFAREAEAVVGEAKKFYAENGLRESVFADAVRMSDVRCFNYEMRGSDIVAVYGVAATRLWVPSGEYLQASGFQFSGSWPANAQEAARLVSRYMRAATTWKFGSPSVVDPSPIECSV